MPTLLQAQSYNLKVNTNTNSVTSVWFDWDQSGTFDPSEWYRLDSLKTIGNINFIVPSNAVPGKTIMRVRSTSSAGNGATNACTNYSYGEAEDYLINVIPGVPCIGTPIGGYILASSNPICSASTLILSDSGSTVNVTGLSYQWQSSTDGINWTNITTGGNAMSDTIKGLSTATYFRRSITCNTSGIISYSNKLQVNVNPSTLCACSPLTGTTLHSVAVAPAIDTVVIIGTKLNYSFPNTVPTGGYTLNIDTTRMPTLQQNGTYTLKMNYSSTSIGSVWFDWNQSGTFETTEWAQINASGTSASINFTVPANATLGKTLMRIRSKNSTGNTSVDACTSFTSGETEDFIINITPSTPCTGTPPVGITVASATALCSTTNLILKDSVNVSGLGGISYQWQSSPDGISWTNIANATLVTDTVKGLATSTYFRSATTCNNSGLTSFSNAVQVTSSAMMCVCSPATGTTLHSSVSPYIDTVSIDGTNLYNVPGSTAPSSGYLLFTDLSKMPSLKQNNTYTLRTAFNGTAIASVWFDWNQSGVFETTEWTQLTTTASSAVINFTVPANATLGKTLMRIRIRLTGNVNAATSACLNFGSGETQDYLINVVSPVNTYTIQGNLVYPNNKIIPTGNINLTGSNTDSTTAVAGSYSFTENAGGNYEIRAKKNNDVSKANGITTLDLALIQAHILGKNLLNSPYKIIAADVNKDNKVTTLDLVYIKRLILGVDTVYPSKTLWAFVDSSYSFADQTNPFPYRDSISVLNLSAPVTNKSFIGIKLGDVNWDWNPALARPASKVFIKPKDIE